MIYPENYRYSKSHEWVLFEEDGAARIGLTDYAQKALGDVYKRQFHQSSSFYWCWRW